MLFLILNKLYKTQHFTVETILLAQLDTEHRLVAEDDGIKFISKSFF